LAYALLLGLAHAEQDIPCSDPLIRKVKIFTDPGCTKLDEDLMADSVVKNMRAGLNQEISSFVEKCAWLENY
jgi:hypothetical protein